MPEIPWEIKACLLLPAAGTLCDTCGYTEELSNMQRMHEGVLSLMPAILSLPVLQAKWSVRGQGEARCRALGDNGKKSWNMRILALKRLPPLSAWQSLFGSGSGSGVIVEAAKQDLWYCASIDSPRR